MGSWLLSSAVKAALLLAASWLGAALLRRSTAAARHQLWALGVAGALLLPLLSWALPSLPLSSASPTIGADRTLFATAVLVTGGGTSSAGPPWLALIWAAGALLVSLRFLRGYLAARRLARAAEPAGAETWLSARSEAAALLRITRAVGLGRSEAIRSPMTVGVLRPRVLLPAAADGWSPRRLHAVLMHELGHVRRRDTLIQLGAQLVCALHWWNPLAWLAAARLRKEREHACDDLVLGAGIQPSSYAADLLEVARGVSSAAAAHGGAICMVDRSWTEARLRRILDPGAPRRPPGAWFRLAARGAALALAGALACTSASAALPVPFGPQDAAPASVGAVSLGEPFLNTLEDPDTFDPEAFRPPSAAPEDPVYLSLVEAEVKRHMGDLKACYEQRLLVKPKLAGMVVMHWTIAQDGKAAEVSVTEDQLADPALVGCLNKLIEEAQFPDACGDAHELEVSFPFVFGNADGC